MNIRNRIEIFAGSWDSWRHDKIVSRFPKHKYDIVKVLYTKQWAKLVVDNSVQAFIALSDGNNQKLGSWKEGDIFKPDTWNSPAKHVRGSVYDENPMACMSEWGVIYLK